MTSRASRCASAVSAAKCSPGSAACHRTFPAATSILRSRRAPSPRPVMDAAFKAANELYADLSAKNQNWKKVFEDWVKFRADQVLWFRVAEREFDSFMAAQKL